MNLLRKVLRRLQPDRTPRDWLLRRMPRRSVCAEIGVFKGDFSARILEVVRPRRLHLIDPWRYETDARYADSWYGGIQGGNQAAMDAMYEMVVSRFARARGQIEIHRAPSAAIASVFPDGYFDWIYIDGNHLYDFVRQDILTYAPKVRVGGFMAGDDYGAQGGWWGDGVTRAVDEFVATGAGELVHVGANQFVLRRADGLFSHGCFRPSYRTRLRTPP